MSGRTVSEALPGAMKKSIRCQRRLYQMSVKTVSDVREDCIRCQRRLYQMSVKTVLDVSEDCIRCQRRLYQMSVKTVSDVREDLSDVSEYHIRCHEGQGRQMLGMAIRCQG